MKIWSEGWSSWFISNNYWRGGCRSKFSSFLHRFGNAIAAFNDHHDVFKKLQNYEVALKDIADWDKNYNLGGDPLPGWHPAKVAEAVLKQHKAMLTTNG